MQTKVSGDEFNELGFTDEEYKEFQEIQKMGVNFSEYSSKSDFSKGELALECFKKVFTLRSKEMKKGYYNYTYLPDGNELKSWIPDSRKEYISSVMALRTILAPEIAENAQTFGKQIILIDKEIGLIWDKFCYEELIKDVETGDLKKTGVKFIPDQDTSVWVQDDKGNYHYVEGGWNLKIEHYWNSLIPLYDRLFEQLNLIVHKNNYFKGKTIIG